MRGCGGEKNKGKKKWRLYQIVWDAMPTATQDEMCGAQRARCHNSNDCYKNIVDLVFEEKSGKYFKCGGISIRGEAAGPPAGVRGLSKDEADILQGP